MKKTIVAAQALAVLLCSWARAADTPEALKSRDALAGLTSAAALAAAAPAAPVQVLARGPSSGQALPNFAQVSNGLYRSGQPSQQGVSQLAAKGVKTILKLNADAPAESDWAAAAGIDLVAQLMDNKHSPSYAEVDQALAVINDPARQPVLVHCHLGHDRTGTVVAAYRVTVQKMSVADAVAEAKAMGYSAPGFDDLTTWLDGYLAQRAGN